ncbi:lipoprotein [Filimonas lacunae]|nr:lipoprotein [Filimonas lacunae]
MAVLFLLVGSFSFAQLRSVPAEVTNAFKVKFPDGNDVSWHDKLSSWQASFVEKGVKTEAWFSSKGEWKETDKEMEYSALPEEVKVGVSKSRYSDWKPGSVTTILKKDKELQYRIYVEKSSLVQKKYIYFNEKGVLQREVQSL